MTAAARAIAEPRVPAGRPRIFGPFAFRDFRLLWTGMLFANTGTWMQFTALGYYVAKLAPNVALGSFYIGLLGASRMFPVLLLSPVAGVVADTCPRRRTLLLTNSTLCVLAIALALATVADRTPLWILMAISALTAATQSFDNPTRQSWVSLLVPRELVGNAIGLNSLAFNGPAVIGPPIAGVVIALVGVSACMVVNAVTAVFVTGMIFFMTPAAAMATRRGPFVRSFVEGIGFVYRHPVLRWVVLMIVVTSLTSRSYNFLLPAYAVHDLGLDAGGLGLLMGAAGGVALLGTCGAMWLAALLLFAVSLGTQAFAACSNILTQTLAPEEMRGRAMSVYTMVMLGLVPGGALLCGSLAMLVDLRWVFAGAGALAAAVGIWVYAANRPLRES